MMNTTEFWLDRATSFHIFGLTHRSGEYSSSRADVTIEKRLQQNGIVKWVVKESNCVLSKSNVESYLKGELESSHYCFEHEPLPSNRTDEFIRDTRFDTIGEAYETFQKIKDQFKEENLRNFRYREEVEVLE